MLYCTPLWRHLINCTSHLIFLDSVFFFFGRGWYRRNTPERNIITEFFKKFGEVTGVIDLGTTHQGVQRIVVSFKKSCVAQGLVNSYQRILFSSMEVKAISPDSLKIAHITFNR